MKLLITLTALSLIVCDITDPQDNACGADAIEDVLGIWYETSLRESDRHPGYTTTDSTIWIFEREPLYETKTSMDSLKITREYHPGDTPFDPTKHSQLQTTLPYNNSETSYGVLAYGNAEFRIPVCDSMTINWTDGTVHWLKRRN